MEVALSSRAKNSKLLVLVSKEQVHPGEEVVEVVGQGWALERSRWRRMVNEKVKLLERRFAPRVLLGLGLSGRLGVVVLAERGGWV